MASIAQLYETPRVRSIGVRNLLSLLAATMVMLLVLGILSPNDIRRSFGAIANAGSTVTRTLQNGGLANVEYNHPLLNAASEAELRAAGIDVSALPVAITYKQESCAIAALGQSRVDALMDGETVTLHDYDRAKHCLAP